MRHGKSSLLANYASEFHVLVPRSGSGGLKPSWEVFSNDAKSRPPTTVETEYAVWACSRVDDINLPSEQEFQERSNQSRKSTDKFSLLKDVEPDKFYNIIGEIIKIFDSGDSLTMYLSDYTSNKRFRNQEWGEGNDGKEGREGDEFGYTKPKPKNAKEWPGPYGQRTIQLTLWDEHAEYVREEIKVAEETWVLLKNVRMEFGKMSEFLEGKLRGDEGKTNVVIMKRADDQADRSLDESRWKEAEGWGEGRSREDVHRVKEGLVRKLEYMKKAEKERQKLLENASSQGEKRKHDGEEPVKKNSKQRREESRAEARKKIAVGETKLIKRLDLNENSMHPKLRSTLDSCLQSISSV